MVGTLVSLAPEVLGNLPHTSASDVYSWAVMANELLSATVPYSDRLMANSKHHTILDQTFNQADLMQAIYLGLRPVVDHSQTPDWVQDLLARTWVGEPLDRPSAHDVASAFRARGIDSNAPNGAEPMHLGELLGSKQACLAPEVSTHSVHKGQQVVSAWEPPLRCDIGSFLTAGRRGWDKMEDCIFLER